MEKCRSERVVEWAGRTLGATIAAGLLAWPGAYVGGVVAKAFDLSSGCAGMFVGVAAATALGINVGGPVGAMLALFLLAVVRTRRVRSAGADHSQSTAA
jgi:hypothetical protein